jgi:DNA replication protein DnaC
MKLVICRSAHQATLLFDMLSKLYERTSVVITTNLSFSEWAMAFGDAKITTALLTAVTSLKPETKASALRQAQPLQPAKRRRQTRP